MPPDGLECLQLRSSAKKTETPAVFLTVMFTGVLATPPQLSQACTTVL
jgi:hypothetical protein